jgi:hypothetical protein
LYINCLSQMGRRRFTCSVVAQRGSAANHRAGCPGNYNQSLQSNQPVLQLHLQECLLDAGGKLGFAANNLFDSHNIVGITPFTAATSTVAYAPNPGDQLNLPPGRSVMIMLTVGWAPKR